MLKRQPLLLKNVTLTSIQVIGGTNDMKIVYVSNLANKFNPGDVIMSPIKIKEQQEN